MPTKQDSSRRNRRRRSTRRSSGLEVRAADRACEAGPGGDHRCGSPLRRDAAAWADRGRRGGHHRSGPGRAERENSRGGSPARPRHDRYEIVDAPHSEAAAAKAVELIHQSKGELLMKGSLHTDELMREVASSKTGLRTARRISHVFIMDADISRNSLHHRCRNQYSARSRCQARYRAERYRPVHASRARHAAGRHTVRCRDRDYEDPSTIEAAALCKMADRKQITGASSTDRSRSTTPSVRRPQKSRASSPRSRPRADPVVPDLESGNMLESGPARQGGLGGDRARRARAGRSDLARRLGALAHGLVRSRGSLHARAAARSRCRREPRWTPSWSSTPALPASSSRYSNHEGSGLKRLIKGQIDGITTRPRLRAAAADEKPLIDETYPTEKVADVPAALAIAGTWLRTTQRIEPGAVGHRGARRTAIRPAGAYRWRGARRARTLCLGAAPPAQQPRADTGRYWPALRPVAGRLLRHGLPSDTMRSPTTMRSRIDFTRRACVGTGSTACRTSLLRVACRRWRPRSRPDG